MRVEGGAYIVVGVNGGHGVAGAAGVSFDILGPLRVHRAGVELSLSSPRLRNVLAVLLLHEGELVGDEHLLTHAWADPQIGRPALRTAISRLRTWLASLDCVLRHEESGYRLEVPPSSLDSRRFDRAWASADDDDLTTLVCRDASLRLWRGEPLEGSPDWVRADPAVVRLTELRRERTMLLASHASARGDSRMALDHLADLCVRAPFDEPAHAAYLRALAECGHPARALLHYDKLRRLLRDELGVAPSDEVRRAHQAILALDGSDESSDETAGDTGADSTADAGLDRPLPAQLPPACPTFAGRQAELAELDAFLAASRARRRPGVCAVFGMAGVGKTTLAVQWAHQVRDAFPDGQLYADLRGGDAAGAAITEVLRGFLDALGVPPARIPAGVDGQIGLYRSVLVQRRVLVVLDNVDTSEQVRPLLPAGSGCLAVVTGRRKPSGLVALDGALPLRLDPLPLPDAYGLLEQRIGRPRLEAEPAAAERIIDRCGGLPLALAVAVGRAALNPQWPLAVIADDIDGGLDALEVDEASLRAILHSSYDALSAPAGRLFRTASLHPGPALTAASVSALVGRPVEEVRAHLAELAQASLLTEIAPDRYACHDLVRAYAAELGAHDDASAGAAERRLLAYYLHSARNASAVRFPSEWRPRLADIPAGVTPERFTGPESALAFLVTEHSNLIAAVRMAAAQGHHLETFHLVWILWVYLDQHLCWDELVLCEELAVEATQRLDSAAAEAIARRGLAHAYLRVGRNAEARGQLKEALAVTELGKDPRSSAGVHYSIALLCEEDGDYVAALAAAERSLELYQEAGDRAGVARTTLCISWFQAQLGEYAAAETQGERALALQLDLVAPRLEASTWNTLGFIRSRLGRYNDAVRCQNRAIAIVRELGDPHTESLLLRRLAEIQESREPVSADGNRRRADRIVADLRHTNEQRRHPTVRHPL